MIAERFLAHTMIVIMAHLLALTASPAAAQSYPSRLVRIVLPFAPGGTTDLLAHALAQQMAVNTGQPVIVDNRPEASGNIGFEFAARAAPDGYTLLMGSIPLVVNPHLYAKVPFDPIRDFTPVSLVTASPSS